MGGQMTGWVRGGMLMWVAGRVDWGWEVHEDCIFELVGWMQASMKGAKLTLLQPVRARYVRQVRQCSRVMPRSPTLGQRTRAKWRSPVRALSCCSPPVVTALQSARTSFCRLLKAAILCRACTLHATQSG